MPVRDSGDTGELLDIGVDSVGQVHLAWPDSARLEMVVATRALDGGFSTPAGVGNFAVGQANSLQLALDRHDAPTVVWLESDGNETRVSAGRRPAGSSVSPVARFELGLELDAGALALAAGGHGDVTVAYPFDSGTTENIRSRVLDASGPPLTVTATASGATASLTAQAGDDAWSPPTSSVAWDFGDGTSAIGASAVHTYAASGIYTVRATASDAVGNTTTAATTVTVTVPSVAPGPVPPKVDRQAPTLSGVKVQPKVLPVQKAAKLVVSSSESAALKGVVERRRTNGPWRPVTKKSWSVEAGANKEKLYGKGAQQRLAPGRYRIRLTATDRAGNVSTMTNVRFRVVA